jgi:cytochrome c-type biogenesis protein CcmH
MTILWILIATITLVVVGILVFPLLRRSAAEPLARVDYDIVVYRDQLSEVDQEVEQGLLTADQAGAARTEIHRRMLAAEDAELSTPPAAAPKRAWRYAAAAAICLLVPIGAGGLYAVLGSPQLPGKPYAWRLKNDPEFLSELSADKLKSMLEAEPTAAGYKSLAGMYFGSRNYQAAADADQRAIDLGAVDSATWSEFGEALVMANGGAVVPQAMGAFAEALLKDPRSERSRFYIGLAEAQIGNERKAVAIWRDLVKSSDPNAAWLPMVKGHIDSFAKQSGFDPNSIAPEPPSPEAMKGALAAMGDALKAKGMAASAPADAGAQAGGGSADPQQDMINGMVAKLANEMKDKPNDVAGWVRLAHAYNVLGRTAEARTAIDRAVKLAPGNADVLAGVGETQKAESPQGENAPSFQATMRKLLAVSPANPQALYYVGLAENKAGRVAAAQAMWRKALAAVSPDDPLAAQIHAVLDGKPTGG